MSKEYHYNACAYTPPEFRNPQPRCDHCQGEKLVEHRFMQGAYGGSHADYPYDPPLVECEECNGTGNAGGVA